MSLADALTIVGLVITVVVMIWGAAVAWTKLSSRKAVDRADDPLAIMQGQVAEMHAQIAEIRDWLNKPIREEDGTMVMSWEHSRDYRQSQKNTAETHALNTEILGGLLELVKELKKDAD